MTLKHTAIRRKGSSEPVRRFRLATDAVEMHTGYDNTERRELWLRFTTGASGVGYTEYRVLIGTEDYAAIIKAMCDVDESPTLSAMADELAARLKKRP